MADTALAPKTGRHPLTGAGKGNVLSQSLWAGIDILLGVGAAQGAGAVSSKRMIKTTGAVSSVLQNSIDGISQLPQRISRNGGP